MNSPNFIIGDFRRFSLAVRCERAFYWTKNTNNNCIGTQLGLGSLAVRGTAVAERCSNRKTELYKIRLFKLFYALRCRWLPSEIMRTNSSAVVITNYIYGLPMWREWLTIPSTSTGKASGARNVCAATHTQYNNTHSTYALCVAHTHPSLMQIHSQLLNFSRHRIAWLTRG